jgi:hypothetical protein
MIQISPGDLVAVAADGRYFYALILHRVGLFGGNWTFVFHRSSQNILDAVDLLNGPKNGYHAFVDFIWAKRDGRLSRVARKVDTGPFAGPGRLKGTHALKEKAQLWFIYDMAFKELKRVSRLTAEEAKYPERARIDDVIMVQMVNAGWTPEKDPRI